MPTQQPSAVWHTLPAAIGDRLAGVITSARAPVATFFRADDIGVPSANFTRLLEIFARHRTPLNLAVVPTWLTERRWREIGALARSDAGLWCWHQHGRRHQNHQEHGKKGEFGTDRAPGAIRRDLVQGRDRLRAIIGPELTPVFTPPWNRCSAVTLELLPELGFSAVSRSAGATPAAPIPDLFVNVDLHTRREPTADAGMTALLEELRRAIALGWCGIMIHHQRMNSHAFAFLDLLLAQIRNHPAFSLRRFPELTRAAT